VSNEPETPVERLLDRSREEDVHVGRRLSRRAEQSQRSLEAYLKAGNRPRWMARLAEIEQGTRREERRLEEAHRTLRARLRHRPERFAAEWAALARRWDFGELNVLIGQHNDWYPIERQLPVDPRTGEYVRVNGRSYRRRVLDAAWVLERFPAREG
jgi:hypothetical protein